MPAAQLATRLRDLLSELTLHLSQMLELLHIERQALATTDGDAITAVAVRKEATTQAIERCEQQRRELLDKHQLGSDSQSMARLARQLPAHTVRELALAWQTIRQQGQDCKQQNQINGIVLAHQQRRTQTALRILRGQIADNEVYSAHGDKYSELNQRTLARI
ncbi:MAG: flagellar protein FlgN [Gammaproteobacteria bacterium]|nr:flagellar protein FlgN [Gammaproteobacteria bacterium]